MKLDNKTAENVVCVIFWLALIALALHWLW